jgi:hypothetical protein
MENRFEPIPSEQQRWGSALPPPLRSHAPQDIEAQNAQALCLRVQDMLPSLIEHDGDIRPEIASAVYGHLAVCPECAREFDTMQRLVALVEDLPALELPMDYSGLIMQRIQEENLAAAALFLPHETITAPPVLDTALETTSSSLNEAHSRSLLERAGLMPRLLLVGALTAAFLLLAVSEWGRASLSISAETLGSWLGQVAHIARHLPVLGWIVEAACNALNHVSHSIQQAYRSLGTRAAQGLVLDVALFAGAYVLLSRRNRARQYGI